MDAVFWIGLIQIIGIDIILSGDNAVVIALACRKLPPRQQRIGVILGAGAAVGLRVIFAAVVTTLLLVPYLKIAGAILLLWIGIKLLSDNDDDEEHVTPAANLWAAVYTILIADAVMSLDNVIAIAAAARGSLTLLILGLLISIPLVVYGATLLLRLINRYPAIIVIGAALLGYIAGEITVGDPVWAGWINEHAHWLHYAAPVLGAVFVVIVGQAIAPERVPAESAVRVGAYAALVLGVRAAILLLLRLIVLRVPFVVAALAATFGFAGGQIALDDAGLSGWAALHAPLMHTVGPIIGAAIAIGVVEAATRIYRRRSSDTSRPSHEA